ncbi:MAG: TetR/AcrR family transcriptional regulator [Jiangellaceae bacterium]
MPYPVPLPGSAPARLIEAAVRRFEAEGRAGVNVVDVARDAGVTTGALYHHFGSKDGLYLVIREEMERRMTERMEGAGAVSGGAGRASIRAALSVAFDAAVRFGVARILSEVALDSERDTIALALRPLLPPGVSGAAPALAGAWRGALRAVAEGLPADDGRSGLLWLLGGDVGRD